MSRNVRGDQTKAFRLSSPCVRVIAHTQTPEAESVKLWARKWLERRNLKESVLTMLFEELGPEDPKSFTNYTRMNCEVLQELLIMVTPIIEKKDTVMRQALPARERLVVTLSFLAAGSTFQDLGYSTRIAPNTLSQIVPETLRAIVSVLENTIVCPGNPTEWEAVAGQFLAEWQFPHCIGAMDGKHTAFRPSRADGSKYRNYKQYDSIILLALVDAHYKFLFVDVGRNGRMHDASVFARIPLSGHLYSGKLNLPSPCPLPGGTDEVPYVIVSDDAFPLKINIMKPYPRHSSRSRLTHEQKIFNYRLSRARRVSENAFGILSNRFRILLNVIPLNVDKVEVIVYTCCLLHNFLLAKKAAWYAPPECTVVMEKDGLHGVCQQAGNRSGDSAIVVRNQLKDYFNSVGCVSWQDKSVEKGNY